MAAYHHVRKPYDTAGSLLIQHGSYQWISREDQPHIEAGEVLLYRGIGQAPFSAACVRPDDLSPRISEIWRKYLRIAGRYAVRLRPVVQHHSRSHQALRDRGLRHGTWLGDDDGRRSRTRHRSAGFRQGALAGRPTVILPGSGDGTRKFGPHYVVVENPAHNSGSRRFSRGIRGEDHRSEPHLSRWPSFGCQTESDPSDGIRKRRCRRASC